jgi:hypothetical protein
MPYTTFSIPVNASIKTLWDILLDKVENPGKYISEVKKSQIINKYHDGVLREMKTEKMTIKERITLDEQAREIIFTLVEHPLFTGYIINKIILHPNNVLMLTFILDWCYSSDKSKKISQDELTQMLRQGVLDTKRIAEEQEARMNNYSPLLALDS